MMLDRTKLLKEIQGVTHELFIDISQEVDLGRQTWKNITNDSLFAQKVKASHTPLLVPTWQGNLDDIIAVPQKNQPYQVAAIDGVPDLPRQASGNFMFFDQCGNGIANLWFKSKPSQA